MNVISIKIRTLGGVFNNANKMNIGGTNRFHSIRYYKEVTENEYTKKYSIFMYWWELNIPLISG